MRIILFAFIFGLSHLSQAATPTPASTPMPSQAHPSPPSPASSIEGLWLMPQDGTLIKIAIQNNIAEGFIFRRPRNRTDEMDKFNPQPDLRRRPILGLKVLSDLTSQRAGFWKGGKAYDPDSGSYYKVHARLKNPDTLLMRGYVFIPLFGRSITLRRFSSQ